MPRLLDGRYELDLVVGGGGMTEVYRANDIRLDRIVAVKTLRGELAWDQALRSRFGHEARSVASLTHPLIVAVYDHGEEYLVGSTPVPYIVMEYVDGRTLRDLLSAGRRLLPERAWEITNAMLGALDYSHRNGVLHKSIRPGNVMLALGGDVKVMDFGITWPVADQPQPFDWVDYLPPELAKGMQVDARSDIYSTACVLYEMLTGRPPFVGDNPVAIAYQHVRGNPIPPSQIDAEIPGWADAIVLKGMAKDPANRYQDAKQMRDDIQRAITAASIVAPARDTLTPTPSGSPQTSTSGRYRPPAVVSAPAPLVLKRPAVVKVTETARRSEPLDDEVRIFNNAKSSSTLEETIRASYTARVSTSVDLSETRTLSGNARVGFVNALSAQASLGNDLMRHYSLQMDGELTHERTTKVTVPAHKHVEITLHWFRIWASGMLTVSERTRRAVEEVAEVPYEITIALVYDSETRDISARSPGVRNQP
jgi:serine/threonine protein kinase